MRRLASIVSDHDIVKVAMNFVFNNKYKRNPPKVSTLRQAEIVYPVIRNWINTNFPHIDDKKRRNLQMILLYNGADVSHKYMALLQNMSRRRAKLLVKEYRRTRIVRVMGTYHGTRAPLLTPSR